MKRSPWKLLAVTLATAGITAVCIHKLRIEGGESSTPTDILTKNSNLPTDSPPVSFPTSPEQVAAEAAEIFTDIGNLEVGSSIQLPLPGGLSVSARVNYAKTYDNGATAAGGKLEDGSGIFEIAREPWGYRGFILPNAKEDAHVYSGNPNDSLQVARRPRGEVICEPDPNWKPIVQAPAPDPQKAAIYNGGRSVGIIFEPIPLLSSHPKAEATIYLDFDGEIIEGHSWEGGTRIIAPAHNMPASEITEIWRRVAEDFAPFEVNVTTDLQTYLRAPQGRRIRCITTTNNFASGAAGVAFNNTFMQSGDPVCWNYYSGLAGALVISHEVGHTLGLSHDNTENAGYYGGHGDGPMSWGPIMGAPYSKAICQWSRGSYPNAKEFQDDLSIIGATIPMREDDHESTLEQATPLTIGAAGAVSNSGLIASPDDIDAFVFTTGGGPINLQFNGAPSSPNLDIEVKLYNSNGSLLQTVSPQNQLSANLTRSLSAGTYRITVDGVGNATWETNGYDDYGSIGEYTITGTISQPRWRFQIAANAWAGAVLGQIAPGTGSNYSIIGGNTGSIFSIDGSTGVLSVTNTSTLLQNSPYELSISYLSGAVTTTTTVPISVSTVKGLKQQIYTNLSGGGMGALQGNNNFPNNPAHTLYSPIFQTGYRGDNFGQRLSGYLIPRETGNHTFWTGADDFSELYLSTNDNPNNKVRIAYNNGNTVPGEWTQQQTQQSAPIALVAGQRYYIEALHREGGGEEFINVAWSTPTLNRRFIAKEYLEYPGTLANRPPWLANMTFRVNEDSEVGSPIGTLVAGDHEPGFRLSNFTITGGNSGGAFSLDAATGILSVNAPLSFVTRDQYSLNVRVADRAGLTRTAQIAIEVAPRAIKREFWSGISGDFVTNLTSSAAYQGPPTSVDHIPFFQTATDQADNYGQRLSGYLRAPDSGNFTFWIASDNGSELWLSTDSNPANKRRISYVQQVTGLREWERSGTQRSAAITLEGGKFYYIEALHKEGIGGDHLAVAWSGPDFGRVILGAPHVTQQFYNRGAPVLEDRTVSIMNQEEYVATLEAKDWADPGTTVRYTIIGGNDDGAFTIDELTGVVRGTSIPIPVGTRVLTVRATDNAPNPLSDTANITVNVLKAGLKREVWQNINGNLISDLTDSLNFPGYPEVSGYASNFQAPTNAGDSYGQRLSGYLIPPASGNYTFWIASDDHSQLFLSTNDSPSNKRMIASLSGAVGQQQWTSQQSQQSVVIPLVAGQPYYIEALHKEGVGGDHLAVAWQGPNFSRTVISANHLEYPETYRPGLRREVWNTANPVKWALNTASGKMEWSGNPEGSADFVGSIFNFKSPRDTAENFSQRLSGYIVPPTTGAYTFWLASDDDGELLLSTDESTANLLKIASITGHVAPEIWDQHPSQKSASIQLVAGNRYRVEVRHREGINGDHAAVAWQGPGISRRVIPNIYLEHPSAPVERTLVQREIWANIAGENVTNLTNHTNFPGLPTSVSTLSSGDGLLAPSNAAENYGQRITSYLVAPEDGRFTFWISSDNSSELWLSTDSNPANRVKIASVSGSVGAQSWETQTSQKSVPIALVSGKRYFLEILHKEGTGTDHLAVAWQGPSFARSVIPNAFLEHPLVVPGNPGLMREVWTGISGSTVASLTSASSYRSPRPNFRGSLPTFETPPNSGDSYGQRITGTLIAPESGEYRFWISADERAELWLSTDGNQSNRMRIAIVPSATGFRQWDLHTAQSSGAIQLIAGRRYHIEVLHKESASTDHMSVAWQTPSLTRRIIDGRYLEYPGTIPAPVFLKREIWTGIGGNNVSNLTSNSRYPSNPNETHSIVDFETPPQWGDNYGQKVSGYLIAPATGNYRFWIASDDGGELRLTTNTHARIAFTTNATGRENWDRFTSQASAEIALVAGQRCYIEALHKEGGGEDYLSVAWSGPGFSRTLLKGRFLEYPGLPNATTLPTTPATITAANVGYSFWQDFHGLTGNDRLPESDPDGDGIPNSLEFILGGKPSGAAADSRALLPTLEIDGDAVIFEFRRASVAEKTDPFAQRSFSLEDWHRVVPGAGVQVTTDADAFGKGVDRVRVRASRSEFEKMFFRLHPNMR